jgi:catechol 2,3-dioxygenase-like lactoylglutathione lyase family enzyme
MPHQVSIEFDIIQHIGIPVKDLEQSKIFYELLGFEEVMRKSFDHTEGKGLCIMMQRGNIMMEFYQLPPATIAREISTRSDGHIDHICFDVKDIDLTYTLLQEAGFNPIQKEPVRLNFWENGVKFFHIVGPDGERLEFNQVL